MIQNFSDPFFYLRFIVSVIEVLGFSKRNFYISFSVCGVLFLPVFPTCPLSIFFTFILYSWFYITFILYGWFYILIWLSISWGNQTGSPVVSIFYIRVPLPVLHILPVSVRGLSLHLPMVDRPSVNRSRQMYILFLGGTRTSVERFVTTIPLLVCSLFDMLFLQRVSHPILLLFNLYWF